MSKKDMVDIEQPMCKNPECRSNLGIIPRKVVKFGHVPTVSEGEKQRYRCQVCAKTFYDGQNSNE
jgi:transposase-like protein